MHAAKRQRPVRSEGIAAPGGQTRRGVGRRDRASLDLPGCPDRQA
jgi:hypothetical protein